GDNITYLGWSIPLYLDTGWKNPVDVGVRKNGRSEASFTRSGMLSQVIRSYTRAFFLTLSMLMLLLDGNYAGGGCS
ncbi:hypothetical protein, partial [Escherichia coli]|uniref:hypothetical protein n=1 Tax=Escherichia coli TaxID=562 RepID=UPI001BE5CF64